MLMISGDDRKEMCCLVSGSTEFVLGFIHNKALRRIGLRIYDVATQEMVSVPFPVNAEFLNMSIRNGLVRTSGYDENEIPLYKSFGDGTDFLDLTFKLQPLRGYAWVLYKYSDGRLCVLGVDGKRQVLSHTAAYEYYKQFGIVGCRERDYELIVNTPNYIALE